MNLEWKSFAEFKINDSWESIFVWHITGVDYLLLDQNNKKLKPFKQDELSSVLRTINGATSITFKLLILCEDDEF